MPRLLIASFVLTDVTGVYLVRCVKRNVGLSDRKSFCFVFPGEVNVW